MALPSSSRLKFPQRGFDDGGYYWEESSVTHHCTWTTAAQSLLTNSPSRSTFTVHVCAKFINYVLLNLRLRIKLAAPACVVTRWGTAQLSKQVQI